MVEKHAIFQGYYFFHHLGLDRNMREQFRGHPCFERTARVLRAVRPARRSTRRTTTLPLEHFEPAVRSVISRPRRSIYLAQDAATLEPAST